MTLIKKGYVPRLRFDENEGWYYKEIDDETLCYCKHQLICHYLGHKTEHNTLNNCLHCSCTSFHADESHWNDVK